jgi:ketosteroid isomerase-like protein
MSTDIEQIGDLGRRWAAAEQQGDTATLEGLITGDFRLVGPLGFVLDRQGWLRRYATGGGLVTTKLAWTDTDTRVHGDTAITIGVQTQQASYQGNPSNGTFRVTQIALRTPDGWRLAGLHLSPMGQFTPPAARPPAGA